MKKKQLVKLCTIGFALPLIGIFLSLGIGETGADFYSKDEKDYQGESGNLTIKMKETGGLPANMIISQVADYNVSIKNETDVNQFIRVMIFPSALDQDQVAQQSLPEEVIQGLDTTKWLDGGDGYYYYKGRLDKGKEQEVFTTVQRKEVGTMTLDVKVEAITAESDTYVTAWWQGTTPTAGALAQIDTTLQNWKE